MFIIVRRMFAPLTAAMVVAICLTGCGNNVEGTYTPVGDSLGGALVESITLKSGGKAELVSTFGQTKEATYEVEGNKVKINTGGDINVFTLDDKGCLDGGQMVGKFCKGGKLSNGASANTSSAAKKSGATAPSGKYECKGPNGETFVMEFLSGGKVKMTATEGGHSDTHEGTWTASGDQVTVTSDEGPMTMTNKGNSLEASMGGMTMTFTKK